MNNPTSSLDLISETNLPSHVRRQMKHVWRKWFEERIRPGDIYVTLAFNGSTRIQRLARERSQRQQQQRFFSPATRRRLGKDRSPRTKIDLGYTKRPLMLLEAQRFLYELCNRIDRFNLGPRYHKKPLAERCSLIAFCENRDTNLHFEAIFRIPCVKRGNTLNDALAVAHDKWRDLTEAGTLNIEKYIRDEKGVAIYITKQLSRVGAWDGFFSKGEFGDLPTDAS